MTKTAILPVVSILFMGVTAITGVEYDKATIENVASSAAIVVTAIISVWGVFKTHKKKEDEK